VKEGGYGVGEKISLRAGDWNGCHRLDQKNFLLAILGLSSQESRKFRTFTKWRTSPSKRI